MIRFTTTVSTIRRRLVHGTALLFLTTLSAAWMPGASAQPAAGESPAAMTREQGDAVLQELKEIRKLLESLDKKGIAQVPQRPPVPQTAKVSIKDSETLGSAKAAVTVVEFTDYQCPYCLKFVNDTFPKLKAEFIDTDKVRWVIRDMPLGFHQNARKAAQAAHCAGEQGKFWEMRSVLFANARQLEENNLPKYAEAIGLDPAAFTSCLASDRHLAGIDQSAQDAGSVQITGTPTFVIGKAAGDWVEGNRVVGARDYKAFEEQILKALGEKPAAAK
jgi:protein-disulfide isomerase